MTRKQIAAYNKMPKKDRGPLKKFREETFTAYQTHWTKTTSGNRRKPKRSSTRY